MGSAAGARKATKAMKAKFGIAPDGKSLFHKHIGRIGGEASTGRYFLTLKDTDPAKLEEIARSGGEAKAARALQANKT